MERSEGKTTDASFCHTHTVVHTHNHVHTKVSCRGWAQVETVCKAWSQVPLLTKLSVATGLTLDLWKQWGRRQGQCTYYLCVCFPFPACLGSNQPPVAPERTEVFLPSHSLRPSGDSCSQHRPMCSAVQQLRCMGATA